MGLHNQQNMASPITAGVKRYLLVRWKKRWHLLPLTAACAAVWVFTSRALHDGHALAIVFLSIVFVVVGILFPFHWSGERGWDEKEWDE